MKDIIRKWLGIDQKHAPYIMAAAKVYNNGEDPMTWDGFGIKSVQWNADDNNFNVVLEGGLLDDTTKFVGFATAFVGDATTSHTSAPDGSAQINVGVVDRNTQAWIRENFDIFVIRLKD